MNPSFFPRPDARGRIGAAVTTIGVLLVAGCTAGPDPERPSTVADESPRFVHASEAQRSESAPMGRWWEGFGDPITNALVENTIDELGELLPHARIELVRVPGAFEVPVTVEAMFQRGDMSCVIALGLVIRGATAHADLITRTVTDGLQQIAIDRRRPVIHEVLLVDNEKQAYARCIGANLNRGREAARAAARMVEVFQEIERVPTRTQAR